MKNLIKNILTAILAITLLIGTSGLQVYKHICTSHNFAGVSLLETPQCEKNHSDVTETDDCCKIEEVEQLSWCETKNAAETYPVNYTSQDEDCYSSIVDSKKNDEIIYPPLVFLIYYKHYSFVKNINYGCSLSDLKLIVVEI